MMIGIIADKIAEQLKESSRPLLVSICGWADVGKSTLTENISRELTRRRIKSNWISTDSFMKKRAVRNASGISGYNPLSLKFKNLLATIKAFTDQKDLEYFPYDNRQGENSTESRMIEPSEVYIIEGIQSFNPVLNDVMALKIFIDADTGTLRNLRFKANINKRGFDAANAGDKIEFELEEFLRFVFPFKKNADINIVTDKNYNYTLQQ
jgi:uridine kinase